MGNGTRIRVSEHDSLPETIKKIIKILSVIKKMQNFLSQ